MANTTPTAIKAALEKVVLGLTPRGKPGVRHQYKVLSDRFDFETASVSDADLGFRFEGMGSGETMSFGVVDSAEVQDVLTLRFGHAKQARAGELDNRIAETTQQLIQELIKPANLPSGVWRIWPASETRTDHEKWVESEISFDITYSIAQ